VEGFEPGMRVLVGGGSGGLAELGTFPATKAIRIPPPHPLRGIFRPKKRTGSAKMKGPGIVPGPFVIHF
ncbi:S-adenosylmethionine synthetase [Rhodobacterales bacterium HTCC2654]|nr:S-adenosylmethionine synthetase [Rhodobacterales bacterium HTCC2654] [Maritimibacter alkaliphilus HTCC2654]